MQRFGRDHDRVHHAGNDHARRDHAAGRHGGQQQLYRQLLDELELELELDALLELPPELELLASASPPELLDELELELGGSSSPSPTAVNAPQPDRTTATTDGTQRPFAMDESVSAPDGRAQFARG